MVKATKEVKEKKEKTEKERKEIKLLDSKFRQVDFYTLFYIENVWNISDRYLREAIKNGSLIAYKVGKNYMVSHTDLMEYFKKHKAKD